MKMKDLIAKKNNLTKNTLTISRPEQKEQL